MKKYELLKEALKEENLFHISGMILGCLSFSPQEAIKRYNLKITEKLQNDPWIAVVETKEPVTEDIVWEIWRNHTKDPDQKNVPYYFICKHVTSLREFVVFTDEKVMYPIDTVIEKMKAKRAGLKKGLKRSHLDF